MHGRYAMTEQVIDWGFRPSQGGTRVDALAGLWRRARSVAENMPPCPCHGIVSGAIDPDGMEHNMLAPLCARYREQGQLELAMLLERRLRKSPFAGLRAAFPSWLLSLPEALTANALTIIYDDLEEALQFYADAPPQFTCA
jgi:hypothetical protein